MTTLPPRRGARRLFQLRMADLHKILVRRKSKRENRCGAFSLWKSGAGKEARTPDLNLGKVALYQLSYSRTKNEPAL